MKEITIDCRGVLSREEMHRVLAQALSFPDHYGRNLDALHDQLTAIRQDTTLVLEKKRFSAITLKPFGSLTLSRFLQSENAPSPILVTLSGIFILLRFEQ